MRIGVLALQGAFIEHEKMLQRLGVEGVEVRLPRDLEGCDGVIIPGGESTTIGKLAVQYHLIEPLRELATSGKPLWGTCAGLIFMAKECGAISRCWACGRDGAAQRLRAAGRFVRSEHQHQGVDGGKLFHAIFIRAPLIESVGTGVDVLARVEKDNQEVIVAAQQGNLLVTSFHPELSNDDRFHRYFVKMAGSKA
jgi:5'-phosphate synthase pdxT subunit